MAFRVSCPGTRLSIPSNAVAIFEKTTLGNGIRVVTAPFPQVGSVSCFVMLAAGSRYETPDSQGHRPLRRAHVLQGDGAATDGAHDLDRDRRDRRRVQRVHRQGAHRLLRPLRLGDPRRRARRPRRHAPRLALRRGRDHEGEGRDPRGDERLPRHAAALRRKRLRPAAVRRSAARLGHHRNARDDRGRDARDLHVVPRHLVPAGAHGRRDRRAASATG